MKHKLLILILLITTSFCFATSVKDLLPNMSEQTYERIMSGEVINAVLTPESSFSAFTDMESMGTRYEFTSNETLHSIVPEGSEAKKIVDKVSNEIKQGFYTETVSFLPYPDKMKDMTDAQKQNFLFNITAKISTLKGIEYFSHTAGDKIIALFKDAYVIGSKDKPNQPIADPVFSTTPDAFSCYATIKDSRFGMNVYQINYKSNPGEVFMDIRNTEKIRFIFIPCVDKEALDMYIDVIQADEGIVLFTMAKTDNKIPEVKVGPLTVDVPSAFVKRIIALGKWFAGNLNE